MKKKFVLGFAALVVLIGAALLISVSPETDVRAQVPCSWDPGDPAKMHFPQLPDEQGWAVNATYPHFLADDWECTETGPVKDVHFWGGWQGGDEGTIRGFFIGIWSDIPADQSPTGHSVPGELLQERFITDFEIIPFDPPTLEHWYDPFLPGTNQNDHQAYYQYNICLEEQDWFEQEAGTIYWLSISADVYEQDPPIAWGWKSSVDHFNDDAVYNVPDEPYWAEMYEPTPWLRDEFGAVFDGSGNLVAGYSPTAFGEQWFEYAEWWNMWWYDHPFDDERVKRIRMGIYTGQLAYPSYLVVAVNWSTDAWSLQDPPPSTPPLPGADEELYIGRAVLDSFDLQANEERHYEFVLRDYNPEWVSVDVRGVNAEIAYPISYIEHQCTRSLDLSFVITGGELTGACCYDDPTGAGQLCADLTEQECNDLNGVWFGPDMQCGGVQACCLPDGGCIMVDSLCCELELDGEPMGPGTSCSAPQACCLPGGGCLNLDPLCCVNVWGGEPQGVGTLCTEPAACCLPDNTCVDLDPVCCIAQGGDPVIGTLCLGDNDQNGTDDACESTACCGMYDPDNRTGNVNQDPANVKDLSDVLMLAEYAFLGGDPPPCMADMNVSGDAGCVYDLSDVLDLASYAFLGGDLPAYCMPECE